MKEKTYCRKRVKLVFLVIVLKFLKYFFMRDRIISPMWTNHNGLTQPLFIKQPVPSQESEGHVCVLLVESILAFILTIVKLYFRSILIFGFIIHSLYHKMLLLYHLSLFWQRNVLCFFLNSFIDHQLVYRILRHYIRRLTY